jgi:hypothetical protein
MFKNLYTKLNKINKMTLKNKIGILLSIGAIGLAAIDVWWYLLTHHDMSSFIGFALTAFALALSAMILFEFDKYDKTNTQEFKTYEEKTSKELTAIKGQVDYLESKILDELPELKGEENEQ